MTRTCRDLFSWHGFWSALSQTPLFRRAQLSGKNGAKSARLEISQIRRSSRASRRPHITRQTSSPEQCPKAIKATTVRPSGYIQMDRSPTRLKTVQKVEEERYQQRRAPLRDPASHRQSGFTPTENHRKSHRRLSAGRKEASPSRRHCPLSEALVVLKENILRILPTWIATSSSATVSSLEAFGTKKPDPTSTACHLT